MIPANISFTIPEILSFFGAAQCVYIMVYMMFRAGRLSRAGLPLFYFLILAAAFFLDGAQRFIADISPHYNDIQWALWFMGPPISVLLIIQIARISRTPSLKNYWVLLLIPLAYFIVRKMEVETDLQSQMLVVGGLLAGGISLLAIWVKRSLYRTLHTKKTGKDRYWLILALIIMNITFMAFMLIGITLPLGPTDIMLIRTIIGLAFVYLLNTSLFRIYPTAVQLVERRQVDRLSKEDTDIAQTIEQLLSLDKVYQEPTYSRADLAKECDTSEAIISRIINKHFQKSFPQLMNEHRLEDAKRMLIQTDAPIKVIAEQTGFNALPTFNRIFKAEIGVSPSKFRKKPL